METDLLQQAAKAHEHGWIVLAIELRRVQDNELWRTGYTSFSDYIANVAKALKLSVRLIWRFRKAYALFAEITPEQYRINAHNTPEETSRQYSPDSFELLDQFRQVMPKEHFATYCADFFEGKLKRDDLRADWKTFRPAIDGKIPRRRTRETAKSIPTVNVSRQREAVALKLSKECIQNYLNSEEHMHQIVFMTAAQWGTLSLPLLDALFIVQKEKDSPPEIHGLCLTTGDKLDVADKLKLAGSCDYFWLANMNPDGSAAINSHIGLLSVNKSKAELKSRPKFLKAPSDKFDPAGKSGNSSDKSDPKLVLLRLLLSKCQA